MALNVKISLICTLFCFAIFFLTLLYNKGDPKTIKWAISHMSGNDNMPPPIASIINAYSVILGIASGVITTILFIAGL